jgi:hypothetical protein
VSNDREKACDLILELMSDGMTLSKACVRVGVPRPTFRLWRLSDPDLAARYARARDELLEFWADEIIDIADDDGVDAEIAQATQRSKLAVDTRKWLLSKLKPDQYGDSSKQTIDMTLKGEDPATVLAARRKAREGE